MVLFMSASSLFEIFKTAYREGAALCADEREANHVRLVEAMPELATGKLLDEEGRLDHIASYVTGDDPDDNVSRDRTDFGFEEDAPLWGALQKSELTDDGKSDNE